MIFLNETLPNNIIHFGLVFRYLKFCYFLTQLSRQSLNDRLLTALIGNKE